MRNGSSAFGASLLKIDIGAEGPSFPVRSGEEAKERSQCHPDHMSDYSDHADNDEERKNVRKNGAPPPDWPLETRPLENGVSV
jgi:hypothetical protein